MNSQVNAKDFTSFSEYQKEPIRKKQLTELIGEFTTRENKKNNISFHQVSSFRILGVEQNTWGLTRDSRLYFSLPLFVKRIISLDSKNISPWLTYYNVVYQRFSNSDIVVCGTNHVNLEGVLPVGQIDNNSFDFLWSLLRGETIRINSDEKREITEIKIKRM
jgi:hypothetical protein